MKHFKQLKITRRALFNNLLNIYLTEREFLTESSPPDGTAWCVPPSNRQFRGTIMLATHATSIVFLPITDVKIAVPETAIGCP
jgi:hypothetical protein